MNLLFDLEATQANESGKRHGGGRYGEIVFFRMVETGVRFSCFYNSGKWLNPEVEDAVEQHGILLFDTAEKSVQQIVDAEKIDRVYSCLPSEEVLYLDNCQVYGTFHGLRRFETPTDACFWDYQNTGREKLKFVLSKVLPKWWYARRARIFRDSYIRTGAKFVVVSDHTKYALLSYFPELKDRDLRVFYSPNTSMCSSSDDEEAAREEGGEKYFLAVSGNRWEKNNARAVEALDRLLSDGLVSGVRMKLTGAEPGDIKYRPKNPDAFDFLGYVSDQELDRLYRNAYAFVYPSLNEGFGYPPLEAMRHKVPVIASPLSSISEVCRGGALYFNPFQVEEIMGRMLMMMDPEMHEEFSQRGYSRYLAVSERQRRDLDGLIEYITS